MPDSIISKPIPIPMPSSGGETFHEGGEPIPIPNSYDKYVALRDTKGISLVAYKKPPFIQKGKIVEGFFKGSDFYFIYDGITFRGISSDFVRVITLPPIHPLPMPVRGGVNISKTAAPPSSILRKFQLLYDTAFEPTSKPATMGMILKPGTIVNGFYSGNGVTLYYNNNGLPYRAVVRPSAVKEVTSSDTGGFDGSRDHEDGMLFEENVRTDAVLHGADGVNDRYNEILHSADASYVLREDWNGKDASPYSDGSAISLTKGTVVTGSIVQHNGANELYFNGAWIPQGFLQGETTPGSGVFGTIKGWLGLGNDVVDLAKKIIGHKPDGSPIYDTTIKTTQKQGLTPVEWAGIAVGGLLLIGGIIWLAKRKKGK